MSSPVRKITAREGSFSAVTSVPKPPIRDDFPPIRDALAAVLIQPVSGIGFCSILFINMLNSCLMGFMPLPAVFLPFVALAMAACFFLRLGMFLGLSTAFSTNLLVAPPIRDVFPPIRDVMPSDQGCYFLRSGMLEASDQGCEWPRSPYLARLPECLLRARSYFLLPIYLLSFTPPGRSPPGHATGPPAARPCMRLATPGAELTRKGVRYAHSHFRAVGCAPRTPQKKEAPAAQPKNVGLGALPPNPRQGACAPWTPHGGKAKAPFQGEGFARPQHRVRLKAVHAGQQRHLHRR